LFTCGANDVTQNLQAKDEYQVQRCFQCLVSPKICNEMKKLILHVKTLISKTEIVSLRETQNVPCSTRNLMHVTKPNVRDDQKYLGLLLSVLKHFVFLYNNGTLRGIKREFPLHAKILMSQTWNMYMSDKHKIQ